MEMETGGGGKEGRALLITASKWMWIPPVGLDAAGKFHHAVAGSGLKTGKTGILLRRRIRGRRLSPALFLPVSAHKKQRDSRKSWLPARRTKSSALGLPPSTCPPT